jgi:DNA-binding LacI/PurR family transcriptional regulator
MIASGLSRKGRSMTSGNQRSTVTIGDVAQRAGVSRALVSIVLREVPGASPENRERVRRAAEELGYRPDQRARLLGSSRSRTIGVVFGLHREFHAEVVEHLYQAVDTTDYELFLGATAPSRNERRAVQTLLDFRCDALILMGPTLRHAEIEELATRLPVVVVARALRSRTVDVVRTDDRAGARLAVEHLAVLGHRTIVHIEGGRAPGGSERRRGYRDAMRDLGLDSCIRLLPGGLTEEDGERAVSQLFGADRPTAVTAFNDRCAVGLMAAVRGRGVSVPDELSVVGFDNSHVAGLSHVALTTVAQNSMVLAASALDLAIRRAEGATSDRSDVVIPPKLVLRRTTAALD